MNFRKFYKKKKYVRLINQKQTPLKSLNNNSKIMPHMNENMTPAEQAIARLDAAAQAGREFMERQAANNARLQSLVDSCVSVQRKAARCDEIAENIEAIIKRGPAQWNSHNQMHT